MQLESVSCANCVKRNKTCDRAQPICNTCIRDGQFCAGPTAECIVSPPFIPSWPEANSISSGDEFASMRRAVSTIVSTPSWISPEQARRRIASHAPIARPPSIPRTLSPDPRLLSNTLPFILGQYMRLIDRISFRSPPMAAAYVRQGLVTRLRRSMISFSAMFLGARIFQAMFDNFDDTNWNLYASLIDRLDGQICATKDERSDVTLAEGRLAGTLDLIGFKFIASDNAAGYSLMRKALPVLIRVAYHYPELWTQRGTISLSRAICRSSSEICGFVWLDNIAAMALGTAPLLLYDTQLNEPITKPEFPLEWLYGCPDGFIFHLTRINMLRSARRVKSESGTGDRWQDIEREVLTWAPTADTSDESRDSVARLAVHESWRHAVLIYLYMGVCGVNSADPRVESSVNQVVQLVKVVKHRESFDRHLFVPCLLAGACARQECQREVIERQLSSLRATRMWILRSSDFTSVLGHLWHGTARDGRAVTWDDYVSSRRAVIPVSE